MLLKVLIFFLIFNEIAWSPNPANMQTYFYTTCSSYIELHIYKSWNECSEYRFVLVLVSGNASFTQFN